jgi:hypothetical protein
MKSTGVGILLGVIAAGGTSCARGSVSLTAQEQALAQRTGLPEPFLITMKRAGRNLRQMEGTSDDGGQTALTGASIDVGRAEALGIVRRLQESAPSGFIAFVSERNYGIGGDPDQVSVLKASGSSEVLLTLGTNGWNHDVSPDMVVARLEEWDARFGLTLRGAGFDWLEAEFKRPPDNMLAFAQEVYKFCPDVVDQGTETVERLATEMKGSNAVYLWWD